MKEIIQKLSKLQERIDFLNRKIKALKECKTITHIHFNGGSWTDISEEEGEVMHRVALAHSVCEMEQTERMRKKIIKEAARGIINKIEKGEI